MAKILDFTGYTSNDLSPDEILENNKGEFDKLVLIGYDPDGSAFVERIVTSKILCFFLSASNYIF